MLTFSPMNPEDENVPFLLDFTSILAADETITSVTSVVAAPNTITVGTSPFVTDGARPKCAVQFTLGLGTVDVGYMITVEIVTSNNVTLARSCYVPVRSV